MDENRGEQLADLAHLVLSVARDIKMAGRVNSSIIEVTELESLVMGCVQGNPGIGPSKIRARIGLRSSNVSPVLRSLERKGMIERIPDPRDRRATGIYPTPLARQNLAKVRAQWAALLDDYVDTGTDIAPTIDLLHVINEAITI